MTLYNDKVYCILSSKAFLFDFGALNLHWSLGFLLVACQTSILITIHEYLFPGIVTTYYTKKAAFLKAALDLSYFN